MSLELRNPSEGSGTGDFVLVRDPRDLVLQVSLSDATGVVLETNMTPDGATTAIDVQNGHVTSSMAVHLGDWPQNTEFRCTVNGGSAAVALDGYGIS